LHTVGAAVRDPDRVFKALADASRRRLLDTLHAHDGRSLSELCVHHDMTRQAVTQHLDVLEAAGLVISIRRGREKLHYLNPVPLQTIYDRWIRKFERSPAQSSPGSEAPPRRNARWLDRHSCTSSTLPQRPSRSGVR
jgi:DNA-binding transcriptional ArsR family regulator